MGLEYVSITLCKALIERLDELVKEGLFANRSQAVRAACWFFLGSGGHVSTIRCPACGGPLQNHGGAWTLKCTWCGNTYRLKLLRLKSTVDAELDEERLVVACGTRK